MNPEEFRRHGYQVIDWIAESGRMFMTHTKLDGKLTLRLSIGQGTTERKHVERAWETIDEAARAIG